MNLNISALRTSGLHGVDAYGTSSWLAIILQRFKSERRGVLKYNRNDVTDATKEHTGEQFMSLCCLVKTSDRFGQGIHTVPGTAGENVIRC